MAATLKTAGLLLDVDTANAHIGRWLAEVAQQRIHGTTGEKPEVRLAHERHSLMSLPRAFATPPAVTVKTADMVIPHESLQHPLSVYGALLEHAA